MKGSADKSPKEFRALFWAKSSDAPGLGDGRVVHYPLGLHLTDCRKGADEIVCAHLGDALLTGSEFKEFLEREFTGLHHSLYLGTPASVGDR
jgi:hypothetical protein